LSSVSVGKVSGGSQRASTGPESNRRPLRVTISTDARALAGNRSSNAASTSTSGRLIVKLIDPTAGQILFEGQDIAPVSGSALRALRRDMQIIFQDPYASLNPRMTVGEIIGEPLLIHGIARAREAEERVTHLLQTVGMEPCLMNRRLSCGIALI
jgi:ABC-type microcin C transport system duplicated ATPase subunit YejF